MFIYMQSIAFSDKSDGIAVPPLFYLIELASALKIKLGLSNRRYFIFLWPVAETQSRVLFKIMRLLCFYLTINNKRKLSFSAIGNFPPVQ